MAHLGKRGVDSRLGRIAFRRKGDIDGGLGQVDSALGVPDDLGRLERGFSNEKSLRIGVANIFGGMNHHAARDVLRILPTVDHAGKPIERRVGIAAAHGLDERGNDVVVHVLVLVVGERPMRGRLAHDIGGDEGRLVGRARFHHLRGEFERGEGRASIAAGKQHDGRKRVVRKRETPAQPPIVDKRVVHKLRDLVVGKGMKLHHARPADERRVHFEEGVFRRCADEDEDAVLDRVEQRVLLAAVETMDLVDEQDGSQTLHGQALFSCVDFPAQIGNSAADGRHLHERRLRVLGDDVGKRGFPRSSGAVEDDRAERVPLDGGAQPTSLAHGFGLPHHFVKHAGAHAHGERSHFGAALVFHCCKQSIHSAYDNMRTFVCLSTLGK